MPDLAVNPHIRLGIRVLEYAQSLSQNPKRFDAHIKRLREQIIASEPRLSIQTRVFVVDVAQAEEVQERYHELHAELNAMITGFRKKQVNHFQPHYGSLTVPQPSDVVRGAQILMQQVPESEGWPQLHKLGAIAIWWGYPAAGSVARLYCDEYFYNQVQLLNTAASNYLGRILRHKEAPPITPFEFVYFACELIYSEDIENMSYYVKLREIGKLAGYKYPSRSVHSKYISPGFKRNVTLIASEIADFIGKPGAAKRKGKKGKRKYAKRVTPQRFVQLTREVMSWDYMKDCSYYAKLKAIGELAGYKDPVRGAWGLYNSPGFKERIALLDREVVEFIGESNRSDPDDPSPDGTADGGSSRVNVNGVETGPRPAKALIDASRVVNSIKPLPAASVLLAGTAVATRVFTGSR